ncbi:MAG: PIG-L family deacetylase, partial [Planctomycetes bacterium]|nr:PIG-L family deacetylase [Planctomycetota bacterium]
MRIFSQIIFFIFLLYALTSCTCTRKHSGTDSVTSAHIHTPGLQAELRQVSDRSTAKGPLLLCIVAHPDDEAAFAATLYKANTFLDGVADLVMITNGEGGFKYSSLGESIYGYELTEEKIGRKHLPKIRAQECVNGC